MSYIHEACIQVLLAVGFEGLTTTHVAERAGVSVGTLYQYYPNKRSLLAALIASHLTGIVEKIEQACAEATGQPVRAMVEGVIDAFLQIKFEQNDISVALHQPMNEVDGQAMLQAAIKRITVRLAALLPTAPDINMPSAENAAAVVVASINGIVDMALRNRGQEAMPAALKPHLMAVTLGYLQVIGQESA